MEIHESAKNSINQKASTSISKIKVMPTIERNPINLQLHNSGTITAKDIIGDIITHFQDENDNINGFSFFHDGKNIGIIGDDYHEVRKIIESILRIKSMSNIYNYKYLEEKYIKWLIERIKNTESKEFIDYLDSISEKDIQNHEVWIPIPFTTIEHDFTFGNVEIRTLTEDLLTSWFSREDKNPEKSQKKSEYIFELKKEYQGYAFVIIKTYAVKERAKEIAYEKTADVLSFIRIFLPANRNVNKRSGLYEYGWKMNVHENYFIVNSTGKSNGLTQSIKDISVMGHMSDEFIQMIIKSKFNQLLCKEEKTEFEEDIYRSILIYSKNTLKNDIFDRLLYILSSLEMILLKNNTEPIQQNLADRIAFACANTVEGRRKIVQIVKDIYSIRSRFVHHGQIDHTDNQLINEFLGLSWAMFNNLVANMHIAQNRLDFIEQLELIKYS